MMDVESARGLVDLFEQHARRMLGLRDLCHDAEAWSAVRHLRALATKEPDRVERSIRVQWRLLRDDALTERESTARQVESSQAC